MILGLKELGFWHHRILPECPPRFAVVRVCGVLQANPRTYQNRWHTKRAGDARFVPFVYAVKAHLIEGQAKTLILDTSVSDNDFLCPPLIPAIGFFPSLLKSRYVILSEWIVTTEQARDHHATVKEQF